MLTAELSAGGGSILQLISTHAEIYDFRLRWFLYRAGWLHVHVHLRMRAKCDELRTSTLILTVHTSLSSSHSTWDWNGARRIFLAVLLAVSSLSSFGRSLH